MSGLLCVTYVHYIAIPKRMLYLKQKRGFNFKDLERKGFLIDWLVQDYHDDIYEDEVLKEIELMANVGKTEVTPITDDTQYKHDFETRRLTDRAKMDVKLNELYNKRKDLKLN